MFRSNACYMWHQRVPQVCERFQRSVSDAALQHSSCALQSARRRSWKPQSSLRWQRIGTWTFVANYSLLPYAWFPPFCCRSVVPLWCSVVPLPFFRSIPTTVAVAHAWERHCWKRLSVYIGMKWPERWLAVHLGQHGKNRIRSCLLRNGRWQRQRRNGIFHGSNVIRTALM